MISTKQLIIACATFSAVLASPLGRQLEQSGNFQLYAYSASVAHSGTPLFFDPDDGFLYAGNPNDSSNTGAAIVKFHDSNGNWVGNPNTTNIDSSHSPTWSNLDLYIPASASSGRIGLTNSTSSGGVQTSGFFFYGSTAMIRLPNGTVMSSWTALPRGNSKLELYWNDMSSGQFPVTIRKVGLRPPIHRAGSTTGA